MSDATFVPRFGRVDPAVIPTLPAPMRREAVLMTMERLRTIPDRTATQTCDPKNERHILENTVFVTELSRSEIAAILGETALTPAARVSESDEGAPDAPPADAPASVSGATTVFAQIRIAADPAGRLDVAEAFAAFRSFCAARGQGVGTKTQFGAELMELARRVGGRRKGAVIHGLAMRGAAH